MELHEKPVKPDKHMQHFTLGGFKMNKLYRLDYKSPIGIMEILGTDNAVCSIMFSEQDEAIYGIKADSPKVLIDCTDQIDEYFKGTRQQFTFPYISEGTDFQKSVWNALIEIPYGETSSYRDIAASIGKERAVRAVGAANGKNRLSIVVPCHRVVGANGSLTGYAGGLWRKEWLLKHERTFK